MKTAVATITLVVLVISVMFSFTAGESMGCETSGVVQEGFPATVTCVFKDGFIKADFMIYRKTPAIGSEAILALCGWEKEKLDCKHFDGFRLKSEESNGRVTFENEKATESQSGTYVCKRLPASQYEATDCTLTVQKNSVMVDGVIGCQTTPASLGEQASVSCTFPKSIDMNGIILEKYNENNGKRRDEIARCERDVACTVKQGYENDFYMPTKLKVNIPRVSTEHTGIYICRSLYLPGATAVCPLTLSTGESNGRSRSIDQLVPPMYGILVCIVLLVIAATILGCLYVRRRPLLGNQT